MTPKKIQNLNKDLRRAKKKVKKKAARQTQPTPEPQPAIDFSPLVAALEKAQQPIVNIEQREPVTYNVTVDLNSRGDMVGARITPMK